jgi:hypothetical protein
MNLKDKTIVVTGANRGVEQALVAAALDGKKCGWWFG